MSMSADMNDVKVAALPAPARLPAQGAVDAGLSDSWRPIGMVALVCLLVLVLIFIGWGALAPLSSAAAASGFVRVEDYRQAVQHRDGGIVADILVEEGQSVQKGQVVLRLDTTEVEAQVQVLASQYTSMQAQFNRLEAERDQADAIQFAPDLLARAATDPKVGKVMESQTRLFDSRRQTLANMIAVLRQRTVSLEEQINGYEQQRAATDEQLSLITEELAGKRELFRKGLLPRPEVLALERAAAALRGTVGQLTASIASARSSVTEIESQILQLQRDRSNEVATLLRDTEQNLFALRPQLTAAEAVLARRELRAPMTGTVVGLNVHTRGGVIAPGQPVMEIIPTERPLLVEGKLPTPYADTVYPGMTAEVKITAFNSLKRKVMFGTVQSVSADKLTDPLTGIDYYRLLVTVPEAEIEKAGFERLTPGMSASVLVPLEDRTLFDYLVGPLRDSVRYGMREP